MRVVLLGSGRGSNAEAVLTAQAEGRLGQARVVALFLGRARDLGRAYRDAGASVGDYLP